MDKYIWRQEEPEQSLYPEILEELIKEAGVNLDATEWELKPDPNNGEYFFLVHPKFKYSQSMKTRQDVLNGLWFLENHILRSN